MVMPWPANQAAARVRELGAGGALLVGEDLGVGQAGVVIDRGVDVVVAEAAEADRPGASAVDPPPATGGDAAELLHIDVDQVAGTVTLVPVSGRA
jgi:hypothetical protein